MLVALTLMMVSVGLSMAAPLLLQRLIDVALPHRDVRLVGWLCGAMVAAGLVGTLASIGQAALTHRVGQSVVHELRTGLYDRVQRMPLTFFATHPTTEVQARLVSDIGGINEVLTFTAQSVLVAVMGLLGACAVMLVLSWPLALASIVLALLLNVVNNALARRGRTLAEKRQDNVSEMLRVVGEDLSWSGVVLGRTLDRHAWQRARFEVVSGRIGDLLYRQRLVGAQSWGLTAVAFACLPPAVYWLAGTVVPGMTLGTVVVISALQVRLSGPIQQLLGLSTTVQTATVMFDRVFDYLDLPATVELTDEVFPTSTHAPTLHLRGVSLSYEGKNCRALDRVDVELPGGSLTVVVGPTGSGKSTLSLIVAGLVSPEGGAVHVSGIGPVGERRLRGLVTLVPQETLLFNASLRENLVLASPDATASEVADVLLAADLDRLVARLPDGLDTPVGERGHQLSGGERQRLAIARGLLARRGVVVLDEATSSLDPETAERVFRGITRHARGRTLVMITHRIPPLRPDDAVVVLDQGRVLESGTHEQLRARGGMYTSMLAVQSLAGGDTRPVAVVPPGDGSPGDDGHPVTLQRLGSSPAS